MAESIRPEERQAPPPIPPGQLLLDDPFLLLVLGILIPVLSYLVWGLLDISSVPTSPVR